MADKLVDERNGSIDEVKIVSESISKCNSCILCFVLFSICVTINVEIAAYFVYYRKKNKENVSVYDYVYQITI